MESIQMGKIIGLDFEKGLIEVETRLGERVKITTDKCHAQTLDVAVRRKGETIAEVIDLHAWANDRGQGLLAALVSISLLSIAMLAFTNMYAYAANIQAKSIRNNAWLTLNFNVGALLQNGPACFNSFSSGGTQLKDAAGNIIAQSGTKLAPRLSVLSVSSILLGTPIPYSNSSSNGNGYLNCSAIGHSNSANGSNCHGVGGNYTEQQVSITIVAQGPRKTYAATYLTNLIFNGNTLVGCD